MTDLPVCAHESTFVAHGTTRCGECHTGQLILADGTGIWPSQEDPLSFTKEQIADWFITNKLYQQHQGCDGFMFARNNLVEPKSLYGYVWIMAVLDLDYEMCYLLDVRRTDKDTEVRQFLFLGMGHDADITVWHDKTTPIFDRSPRSDPFGLHFFAQEADTWADRKKAHVIIDEPTTVEPDGRPVDPRTWRVSAPLPPLIDEVDDG